MVPLLLRLPSPLLFYLGETGFASKSRPRQGPSVKPYSLVPTELVAVGSAFKDFAHSSLLVNIIICFGNLTSVALQPLPT